MLLAALVLPPELEPPAELEDPPELPPDEDELHALRTRALAATRAAATPSRRRIGRSRGPGWDWLARAITRDSLPGGSEGGSACYAHN